MKTVPPFILASASPARRKLLEMAGFQPLIYPSDFDESQVKRQKPLEFVQTLAYKKADTITHQVENSLILGCDSMLVVNGELYGKPDSIETAIKRWQEMSGNHGQLYTGHALIDQVQNRQILRCGITTVYFSQISDRLIEDYVKSGEPLACAGAFAIDGKGGLFIEKLEGCHSNVIGLSLPLLRQMLTLLNYQVTDFWQD